MMSRILTALLLVAFISGCATTKVYNLDKHQIPAHHPNGMPSVNEKWADFDTLLTEYYLPIDWDCNKYISKRHLLILRASEKNQKKFRFFFGQYWGKEIAPEEESASTLQNTLE